MPEDSLQHCANLVGIADSAQQPAQIDADLAELRVDPAFLAQLARRAVRVTLTEGESRAMNVTIAR